MSGDQVLFFFSALSAFFCSSHSAGGHGISTQHANLRKFDVADQLDRPDTLLLFDVRSSWRTNTATVADALSHRLFLSGYRPISPPYPRNIARFPPACLPDVSLPLLKPLNCSPDFSHTRL